MKKMSTYDLDEEEELEAEMDALDEAMFGEAVYDTFPRGNELNWNDHFLNDRESGAGPNVSDNTPDELISEGFTKHEVAEALRKKADELSNEEELSNE
jgi:hypothetical protein